MSAATGLQSLFARMLVDPSLIAEFETDTEGFAARHGADPAEVRQLRLVDTDRIRAVSGPMIVNKVVWTISHAFPATGILLRELASHEDRLARAIIHARLQSIRETRPMTLRLETLADILAAGDIAPVLRSVIRFEVIWYRLRHSGGTRHYATGGARFAEGPLLRPDVAVEAFDRPVAKAHQRILANAPFDDLGVGTTYYVMRAVPGGPVRVAKVSEQVSRVLRACDGTTAPEQMSARLHLPLEEVERVLRLANLRGLVFADFPTVTSPSQLAPTMSELEDT